jgi:two-component system response regulator AtoC
MTINKIFIVDDDQFYTHILEAKLLAIGNYSIEKYYSGIECIDNAHKQPDMIFLDHILGDTTGLEVLKEVKATYPSVHVVILSGQKEMKVAISSLRFGATDYLLKDIDDSEKRLREIIQDCTQISKARTEVKQRLNRRIREIYSSTSNS